MAHYTFRLRSFEIDNTRARGTDTDYVAFALTVGDTTYPTQIVPNMGDLNNGSYAVDLTYKDVLIPASTKSITMSYQIINAGHSDPGIVENGLKAGAKALADKGVDYGTAELGIPWASTFLEPLAEAGVDYAFQLADPNCDGPVAVDAITFTPGQLYTNTTDQTFLKNPSYPGTDSASGCGGNSEYAVMWSVERSTQGTLAYHLGLGIGYAAVYASYGYDSIADAELQDTQRTAEALAAVNMLSSPAINLIQYAHDHTSGTNLWGGINTVDSAVYGDLQRLGPYSAFYLVGLDLGIAGAQCTFHDVSDTTDRLAKAQRAINGDAVLSQLPFDTSALNQALNQAGFACLPSLAGDGPMQTAAMTPVLVALILYEDVVRRHNDTLA
jgi:hypothetical protein